MIVFIVIKIILWNFHVISSKGPEAVTAGSFYRGRNRYLGNVKCCLIFYWVAHNIQNDVYNIVDIYWLGYLLLWFLLFIYSLLLHLLSTKF